MKIVGISGSTRKGSLNEALLLAAAKLCPDSVQLESVSIKALPIYDHDIGTKSLPDEVGAFRDKIAQADGVIIATPEFNYGIPGTLKNALDWVSRPAYNSVFAKKPVVCMGATPSFVGTARAQTHLRQILFGLCAAQMPYPEFLVNHAFDKFKDGNLLHGPTSDALSALLQAFSVWISTLEGWRR